MISSARLRILFIRPKIQTLKKSKLLHITPNECSALSAKSLDFFFSLSPVIIKMEVIIDEIISFKQNL